MRILLVSDNEQSHVFVRHTLQRLGWTVSDRFSLPDAMALLDRQEFPVVLCDRDLETGDWKTLLEKCESKARPSRLIVFCRVADVPLWAEVLNLGAYDLLMYPFEPQELIRVTTLACESWSREAPRNNVVETPVRDASEPVKESRRRTVASAAAQARVDRTYLRKAAGQ